MVKIQDYEALRHSVTVWAWTFPREILNPTLTLLFIFYIQNLIAKMSNTNTHCCY